MSSKKRNAEFLKGFRTYRVKPEVTIRLIEEYLRSLDCPRALTVWLMFVNNEHRQLAELECDPMDYRNMVHFRDSYAATEFLSKFKGLSFGVDKAEVAVAKFLEDERLCKETNARFRDLSRDPTFSGSRVWLHNAVIRKIDDLLGEFDVEEFFSMPDWGPGATTQLKRRNASSVNKFQLEVGITRDLYDLLVIGAQSLWTPDGGLMEECYPLWFRHLRGNQFPKYHVGNKVITVPKNAKTDRVIAVEPGLNLFFQKAIGNMIGHRLRRDGVDLRYQAKNQLLAKEGSVSLSLATVDLSSASDSISISVVEALLPPRWHLVMDACRSHYGLLGKTLLKWEKFSSMGNGFTFPLESLIFYAVAFCCAKYIHPGVKPRVSVYGDDIIIPVDCLETFSEMLAFYGFRVNAKKTHFASVFRESCGAHYYSGVDVKPYYLKDSLINTLSVFRAANAVRRLAHRRMSYLACDASFRKAFDHLVQSVPGAFRLRIPEGLGDGGFISNFDEATPAYVANFDAPRGYRVRHVTVVSQTYVEERVGYLLAALWRMPTRDDLLMDHLEGRTMLEAIGEFGPTYLAMGRNSVPSKRGVSLRFSYSIVPQWYDLGPWL